MSNDPLGGRSNSYQYVAGNPLNLIDPNGLSALSLVTLAGTELIDAAVPEEEGLKELFSIWLETIDKSAEIGVDEAFIEKGANAGVIKTLAGVASVWEFVDNVRKFSPTLGEAGRVANIGKGATVVLNLGLVAWDLAHGKNLLEAATRFPSVDLIVYSITPNEQTLVSSGIADNQSGNPADYEGDAKWTKVSSWLTTYGAVGTETWQFFNSQGALRGSGGNGFGSNNAAEQFLHGDFCIEGICSAPQ